MPPDRLRIIVEDVMTGERLGERVIYDDYCLVTSGLCYLHHTQQHANGTTQLTIKKGTPEADDG